MAAIKHNYMYPQEIEVCYLLPSIRKEFAVVLKKKGFAQKKISQLLGVTEAAVSNYISSKRASFVKFNDAIKSEISSSADKILSKENCISETIRILKLPQVERLMCELHKKIAKFPKNCDYCFAR